MSQSNDIINAIVAAVTTDLSDYTKIQGTHRSLSSLDAENLPFAMFFNPEEEHSRDDLGNITEEITVTCFLVRPPDQSGETEQTIDMRTDVDSVKARFDVDPRIDSTVDFAYVSSSNVVENLSEHTVAVMEIKTTRMR